MFDLHRHDEFSAFDGFNNADEVAACAAQLGYKSVCTTNHGNTNGLLQTYKGAKKYGLKPILGVEGYFLPVWKEKTRGYHMCLVAKNLKGYENMNRAQYEGEQHRYYNSIWSFETLEKYHEGLICTTACVAGYLAQSILKDEFDKARKFLKKLKKIFGDDLYVEVQPYVISDPGMQERVNVESIKLAKELDIKLILTSDSHRAFKGDFDTYLKMHEIAGHSREWVEGTYNERYMPEYDEMRKRFYKMHKGDFGTNETKILAREMYANLDEIEEKCEDCYLDDLPLLLPKVKGAKGDSFDVLKKRVIVGLKERGKYEKEYIERCKEELKVIKYHGFGDYFLIVADYVNWAKEQGIAVAPGRGSVCNCLVAYALKITEVDSLYFGLDFRRFLRIDKSGLPDIDLDFMPSRRHEVITHICTTYEGKAARIASYGLYKVDNLLNDLAKVCGVGAVQVDEETGKEKFVVDKSELSGIKSFCRSFLDPETEEIDEDKLKALDASVRHYDGLYDGIITHFTKMYRKVRFIGTHAAGVAVTDGDILQYTALRVDKSGDVYTAYDLNDLDSINLVKFDILGLKTEESIADLRASTGVTVDFYKATKDPRIFEEFRKGNTDGVFQFESKTAREILSDIECDCFADVCAANAMNRPAPLSQGMPAQYAENKQNGVDPNSPFFEYTGNTYGTIVYQEQVMLVCVNIGGFEWSEADEVMKILKHTAAQAHGVGGAEKRERRIAELRDKFLSNAVLNGVTKAEASEMFEKMFGYTFNQGHATGYSLIAVEEMFYKVYYPIHYWFAKLKYAKDEKQYRQFCEKAVLDGAVIFLPHVNYSTSNARLRKCEGEQVIQQGLSEIKGVGEKAAAYIVEERKKNGIFISYDDFYDRCKSRLVTTRVISILKEQGALEFSKKKYVNRVTKYNATLYARAAR